MNSRWMFGSSIGLLIAMEAMLALSALAEPVLEPASSWPPDTNSYQRPAIYEDVAPKQAQTEAPTSGASFPSIFVVDPNNVNFNGYSEPSIAINPIHPNIIDIHGGFGGWNGNADLFHSTDGGVSWTHASPFNSPPDNLLGCPCDTTIDWGASLLAGAFLSRNVPSPEIDSFDIFSATTPDPSLAGTLTWNTSGAPPVTQLTNNGDPSSLNGADQPWLLVNRDVNNPTKQNVYVGYDNFNFFIPSVHVAMAALTSPLDFKVDGLTAQVGGGNGVNPGHRLAADPRNGYVYSLYQLNQGGNGGGTARLTYRLNRSTDNGATWGLNDLVGQGIDVAIADSDQPLPKFGTVNALLGGVDHAAVDPTTGDVYVVYGNRDSSTGNNRLAIRRLQDNGSGRLNIGAESFVTGQVQSALPSLAVTSEGTVGVLYDTFDGFSTSGNLPIFSAHLATSTDRGVTFTDQTILTFLSPSNDDGSSRQRVLGDYQQMKAVGGTFFGVFAGNGAALGRSVASIDPIFFKAVVAILFDNFSVKLRVKSSNGSFRLNSAFSLGAGGIDPPIQDVTLEIGSYSVTIPSGSFTQKHQSYTYKGTVEGVSLRMKITLRKANTCVVSASGKSANLRGVANPVTVTLSIGNSTGSATVNANIK
jgi:hypothetical protein